MFTALHDDPRLAKLDKSGQDLVMALAEALSKQRGPSSTAKLLKDAVRLKKTNPTAGDVHVSTELTDLSVAHFQDQGAFVSASRGIVSVAQKSDLFQTWNRGDLFRDEAQERAPASESAGGGFKVSTTEYTCKRFAYHKDVDDEVMANQRVGDPRQDALAFVVQKMLIRREAIFAANFLAASVWTKDRTGVDASPTGAEFLRWNVSGSTPRTDLATEAVVQHELTGVWPNILVLQPHVLKELLLHADIVDAFKHTTAGATPTLPALAQALFALGVAPAPTILVAGGVKATSAEGVSDAFAYIAGKHALLAYVPSSPGLRTPSAWYIFSWENEVFGTNAMGVRISDFEIEEKKVPHRVEGEIFFDAKVVAKDHGTFFSTAVA